MNSQFNARGFANVKIKSEQTWELVYQAPHQTHVHNPSQDIDLFNVRVDGDTFVQFAQYKYQLNGEMFYISSTLDRVVVSEAYKISHVVAACEQANRHFVLQVGDEIGLDQ